MVSVTSDWSRVELIAAGLAVTIGQVTETWNGTVPAPSGTDSIVAAVVVGVVAAPARYS